jgi:phage head maturation protease
MADNFSVFIPLTKVERQADGSCLISGYASTPALDLDGEIITKEAVKKALPGYWQWRNIREMHTNSAVGVAKEANMDDKGLFLTSRIVDKAAVEKCLAGVYKGYSVGGKKLAKNGNTITEIELVEISVVDRPANPECAFTVAKSASKDAAAYLTKLPKIEKGNAKTIEKLVKAALTLNKAGPPESLVDPVQDKTTELHPMKCAAHGLEDCDQGCCKAHGAMDCKLCMDKRDFSTAQRQDAADTGAALPDGSFPIKNKEDLSNARQAVGRAKDPGKARAHIRSRAQDLGVKLPDNWSKKLAKRLIAEAEGKLTLSLENSSQSAVPPFLTLTAGSEKPRLAKLVDGGHTIDLRKGGGIDTNLEFLTLTRKDAAMDKTVDFNDNDLAKALMLALAKSGGAKVTKAGRMTMARDDIKKARSAVKDIEACMKSLHAMHKASYLSKAGKAPPKKPMNDGDADDFDHAGAMQKIQKAYGTLQMVKTLTKSAGVQLKKAAGRSGEAEQEVSSGNEHYQVPAGIKDLSPGDMATAGGGSMPFEHGMIEPFPGKGAKAKSMTKYVTSGEAEALARAAAAEAKVEILESMPAGPTNGRRPAAFDVSKVFGSDKDEASSIMKGVSVERLHNPDTNRQEVGKMIGNMILGGHGKSVFDSDFRGAAGVKS